MLRWRRVRVTVDPKVQGLLCLRVAAYWTCCFLGIAFLMACSSLMQGSADTKFSQSFFLKVASLSFVLLPMALFDCIKFSNRICGPIRRLRNGLHDLAQGKEVQSITLRPGDFCQDIVDEFNALVARNQSTAPQTQCIGQDAVPTDNVQHSHETTDEEPVPV